MKKNPKERKQKRPRRTWIPTVDTEKQVSWSFNTDTWRKEHTNLFNRRWQL